MSTQIVKTPIAKIQTDFQVFTTTSYQLFKRIKGNRAVNPLHLSRLKKSMQKQYLFSPIIVNERLEIIDGQHRFDAASDLGLPVYYIKVKGYGLTEIQMLNSNTSNWNRLDYLQGFCDLGRKPYIQFRKIMQDFPDFGFMSTYALATIGKSGAKRENGKTISQKDFQNGNLFIPDIEKTYEYANKLMEFKAHYAGFHRITFVRTMIGLFQHPNYKHKEMLRKLEMLPGFIRDCTAVDQYKIILEDAYNYKRQEKVNLRY